MSDTQPQRQQILATLSAQREDLLAAAAALCHDRDALVDPDSLHWDEGGLKIHADGSAELDCRFSEVRSHACRGVEERIEHAERLRFRWRAGRIEVEPPIDWRRAE